MPMCIGSCGTALDLRVSSVEMNVPLAWAILGASAALLLVASLVLRTRLRPIVVDVVVGLAGAGVAVGGLLFLDEVGVASWIVAPVFLAIAAIVHVRALFAGTGPFRT
jgi:orotate phosphoribosyltransferase-like protein